MPTHTIAENIQRLRDATAAISTAITTKGGTVSQGDGLEDFAADIATIPSGSSTLIEKSITENGTYNASSDNADGYSKVVVNVGGVTPTENYPDLTEIYSVCHRGYDEFSSVPENSIEAFGFAKKYGYKWIETDIRHTSDHVPILSHDATINVNEVSSSLTIASTSWSTLSDYSIANYTNEVCSLEAALTYCKNNDIYMYIELKDGTQSEIEADYAMVDRLGMKKRVVWISFDATLLGYVKTIDSYARLQYLAESNSSSIITTAEGLKTANNQVGIDIKRDYLTQSFVNSATTAGLTVSTWTVTDRWNIVDYYRMGVKQFTTETLIAEDVINSLEHIVIDSDFVNGKIMTGVDGGLDTTDTTRVSYYENDIPVQSASSFRIIGYKNSSDANTVQMGAQILSGAWYKCKIRNTNVSSTVPRIDSGWKATNSSFTMSLSSSEGNNPTIMVFTFRYSDNSTISPTAIDRVEIDRIATL